MDSQLAASYNMLGLVNIGSKQRSSEESRVKLLETEITESAGISPSQKIVVFALMGIFVFGFFGLLGLGLMNKSPVTARSGLTRVGKVAPEISMPLLDGGQFVLSEHAGQPIVVNFWASWCPPCRDESPGFERTWRRFADTGFQMVGVDIQDTVEDGQAYVREFDLTFVNGIDTDGKLTVDYGVIGLPVTFFIGADGIVKGRWVGALPEDRLVGWVEALLEGATPTGASEVENPDSFFEFQ
jgi:peroxiredoxin